MSFFVENPFQIYQITEVGCSTGVDHYTIYTFHQEKQINYNVVQDPDARWSLVEGLSPGNNYNFKVTLSTTGGESQIDDRNNGSNLFLPGIPPNNR